MKRRTVIALALAGLAVLLLALNWRGLPNFRTADNFGPIPRFMWIPAGQPRPSPALAYVIFGNGPRLPATPRNSLGRRTTECLANPDIEACLRRNWLAFLTRFGAAELTAAENENSYRFFRLPSSEALRAAGPWTMGELHVPQDGKSVLEIATLGGENDNGPAIPRRVSVDPKPAISFERKIQASSYGRVAVDPRGLRGQDICYDGVTYLFEAQVRGSYRYAIRRFCEVDADKVKGWGERLLALQNPPAKP